MATTLGREAGDFVRACENIHFLLTQGTLQPDDRSVIEFSATDLLEKLKSRTGAVAEGVGTINGDHDGECKEDQQGKKDILERSSVGEPARRIEVKGDQQW
jgi:hypothetical protein